MIFLHLFSAKYIFQPNFLAIMTICSVTITLRVRLEIFNKNSHVFFLGDTQIGMIHDKICLILASAINRTVKFSNRIGSY